jgi:hypothetical protein
MTQIEYGRFWKAYNLSNGKRIVVRYSTDHKSGSKAHYNNWLIG